MNCNIEWHHSGCWWETEAGPAISRVLRSELLKSELAPETRLYQVLQVILHVKVKCANHGSRTLHSTVSAFSKQTKTKRNEIFLISLNTFFCNRRESRLATRACFGVLVPS